MQSPLPLSSRRSYKQSAWSLVTSLVFVAIAVFVWTNQQLVIDAVKYWQYSPTGEMTALSNKLSFTDKGHFVFYATQPQIDGSSAFNAKCSQQEQNAAILGCYVGDRIYLYDVTDARLNGIKEVTAAHEMLHAVYQRMSASEETEINKLVEAEYTKLKDNKDLADRMAFYDRTEPGERDNELHSIIGTEVASVSSELESHYAKYLANRAAIVGYYETYHQAFATLEAQKDNLSTELDLLSKQIDEASADYNVAAKQVQKDIESFNNRADSGGFSSQSAFNAERATLVGRVNALVKQRDAINDLIARYNNLRDQYNETITQSNELYKSIDSKLAPTPQV